VLHFCPHLQEIGVPLALELYIPFLLESMVWHQEAICKLVPRFTRFTCGFNRNYCGSTSSFSSPAKDNGLLAGVAPCLKKRTNPHILRQDPTFRQLIDVIPHEVPPTEPRHS
jgi:hypothetical protein